MPSEASQAQDHVKAYAQRMNKVLDHIDRHLDQPLELAALADVAHFSLYHFHRVFMAWMEETLGDYLRRRRLDVAAFMLSHQRQISVLEVALSVGFGSGEAFARAFKTRFGRTPSAWRHDTAERWAEDLAQVRRKPRHLLQQDSNPDQAGRAAHGNDGHTFGPQLKEHPVMNISIQTLPPARVAYMRHIGPYGPA
jgi:AraC family transcriptional regulator